MVRSFRRFASPLMLLMPAVTMTIAAAGEPRSVVQCIADLQNADVVVRRYAARELRRLGPAAAPAAEKLLQTLEGDDVPLNQAAADALVEIGEPILPLLLERLPKLAPSPQAAALQVFARYADKLPDSAPVVILPLLQSPDEELVERAGTALGSMGPKLAPIVTQLFELGFDEDSPQSAKAVAARGALHGLGKEFHRILPLLAARLETTKSGESLHNAGNLLAWLKSESPREEEIKIIPDLVKLARSPSGAVHTHAMFRLARLGGDARPAVDGLETLIRDASVDKRARYVAVRCLTAIVGPAGVSRIIALADVDSVEVRAAVVVSLAELGLAAPGVRKTLEAFLDDDNEHVRGLSSGVLAAAAANHYENPKQP